MSFILWIDETQERCGASVSCIVNRELMCATGSASVLHRHEILAEPVAHNPSIHHWQSKECHGTFRNHSGSCHGAPHTSEGSPVKQVKHLLGMLLQLLTLSVLPLIIVFQLFYGFRLIVMPISLLVGITLFSLGTALRESK